MFEIKISTVNQEDIVLKNVLIKENSLLPLFVPQQPGVSFP